MMGVNEVFSGFDSFKKQALANLAVSPLRLGMAGLYLAKEEAGVAGLTAPELAKALLLAGVYVSPQQLVKAFNRSGGRVAVIKDSGLISYSLMTSGAAEVSTLFTGGGASVFSLQAGKPYTARVGLETILRELSDEVLIFDTYYGVQTLDTLRLFSDKTAIKFLTIHPDRTKTRFDGLLPSFKSEFPNIQLRSLQGRPSLHDRYIVCQSHLVIIGHGVKDLGASESFIVVLGRELVPDLVEDRLVLFQERWDSAVEL